MARKQRKRIYETAQKNNEQHKAVDGKHSFFEKGWMVAKKLGIGIGGVLIATLGFILINGNSAWSNLRNIPSELEATKDTFLGQYYNDSEWVGLYSSSPEGYIDTPEIELSNTDVQLVIDNMKNGKFSGSIVTKGICEAVPALKFVLFTGEAKDSRSAEITISDYIFGRRFEFATLNLLREGSVITITAENDDFGLFQKAIRIAKHPDTQPENLYDEFRDICEEERNVFNSTFLSKLTKEGDNVVVDENFPETVHAATQKYVLDNVRNMKLQKKLLYHLESVHNLME